MGDGMKSGIEPGLRPLSHGALNHCFGCGIENRSGLRLRFFEDEHGQIVCPFRLAARFAGPPGYAHGGIIATLLDEAMSKSNRAKNIVAMTRHLEVDYLRPVPLKAALTLTARHTSASGRKHHCEAEIVTGEGEVLARGKALFIEIDPERFRKAQTEG